MFDGCPDAFRPHSLRTRLARRAAACRWTAAAILAVPLLTGILMGVIAR